MVRTVLIWLLGLVAGLGSSLRAQETQPSTQATRPGTEFDGRICRELIIQRAQDRPPGAIQDESSILGKLRTQVGKPFRKAVADEDILALWSILKIATSWQAELLDDGQVRITFSVILEPRGYDRVLIKGNEDLSEEQIRKRLSFTASERMNDLVANTYLKQLTELYRREGHYFAVVTIERDDAASTLTFRIDEGPKVTVRSLEFRGNRSIPGWAPVGLRNNLIGSAALVSEPAGKVQRGNPYSEEAVDEDLERLRLYYRGIGFRDAQVELVDRRFSEDRSEVDLTIRVEEGRRYRIIAVDLEQFGLSLPKADDPPYVPRYPRQDVLNELRMKPGDYYERSRLRLDMLAIERFYGERGHPPKGRYSFDLRDTLQVLEPSEVFDPEQATVKITFRVIEGTPKRLHDVQIRGNTRSQDRIIRRQVQVLPGELLDVNQLERSLARLEGTRWFTAPEKPIGVAFSLEPVDSSNEEVDLVIDITEGDTGQFRWGAGFSTEFGPLADFQFTKRNFDLFDLPSSANPSAIFGETFAGEAFHGGGQEFDLHLSPGTRLSRFNASWYEPDLFKRHFDTIGMRVQGYRRITQLEGYVGDSLGVSLGFDRQFTPKFNTRIDVRDESVNVKRVEPNAPQAVFDAKGQTELRGARLQLQYRDVSPSFRPSEGIELSAYGEVVGGPFGAEESFVKAGVSFEGYLPLYRDSLDRTHFVRFSQRFDFGHAFDDSDDLFLTERFFMGGANLRGFSPREAGPAQFGRPLGGEVRYLGSIEFNFPLVSTRLENSLRETDLVRGVAFTDFGLLGTALDDRNFREPRLSAGLGIRIYIPQLQIPIAIDYAWPLVFEESDSRERLFFSFSR